MLTHSGKCWLGHVCIARVAACGMRADFSCCPRVVPMNADVGCDLKGRKIQTRKLLVSRPTVTRVTRPAMRKKKMEKKKKKKKKKKKREEKQIEPKRSHSSRQASYLSCCLRFSCNTFVSTCLQRSSDSSRPHDVLIYPLSD